MEKIIYSKSFSGGEEIEIIGSRGYYEVILHYYSAYNRDGMNSESISFTRKDEATKFAKKIEENLMEVIGSLDSTGKWF